ncbi:peptide MFS transporter [Campylobacter sp. VicNov18]|uniref:peptide MFS transporter n=1 Tax=Campylobacter bilis TaxID=2691918 RepID=UPI00130EA3EB|nr:peptide MFS transporter [Campylobacter bilis]MPV63451.1 MFS transporter [Campylobacter hepaticus]MBM0636950.1 MFS transporter [Campylobacter bilis]MCC8277662.1 peptide MFS transporter [Campylobacter bilis]MCC8299271.1 peptide MFS transporter [Campylobacter bilis]MCC8300571.1 peptide MFS transporter [Campylobacter bilis]
MQKKINTAFLGHPKPLFSLSMIELWERFSFYGIRPLLVLFMSAAINLGGLGMERESASAIVGIFAGCLYLAALPGGWLADNYLGQKKAIFLGSILIALGHLSIALSIFNSLMFFIGLGFIVVGTGLFKTCASVMVGMLYKNNDPRRDSGFTIFYMGINLGAFFAPLICGFLQKEYGWHLGFGTGGLGMLLAVIIFYFKTIPDLKEYNQEVGLEHNWEKLINENKNIGLIFLACLGVIATIIILSYFNLIDLSPVSLSKKMIFVILTCTGIYFLYLFFFSSLSKSEKKNLVVFVILFFMAAFFWSFYEQQPTSFNLFAEDFTDRVLFGWEIPTPWFQSLTSIFVIVFAPVMSFVWIFLQKHNLELSSISKFALGILGAGICFMIMMFAAKNVLNTQGGSVSMLWLVASMWFLTLGELCLSPVGLSIMTQIAPNLIKSQVMGLWFVAGALGNVVAGLVGGHVDAKNIDSLPDLFGQCMWFLFIMAIILFLIRKPIYKMVQNEKGKK